MGYRNGLMDDRGDGTRTAFVTIACKMGLPSASRLLSPEATSYHNGEAESHYHFINQGDAIQNIPCQLVLDSGSQQLALPNQGNKLLALDAGGRPVYDDLKTSASKNIKKVIIAMC